MVTTLKECEDLAIRLGTKERALRAEHPIASLDVLDESDNETVWLHEWE